MNVTILFDSIFGNTAKVAHAVADALGRDNQVRLATMQDAGETDLSSTDLLIIGSPTRGFRPTPQIQEYLAGLDGFPNGMVAAVFDTRLDLETVQPEPLRWVIDVGGYANHHMAAALRGHGIELRGAPGAFLVTGNEGPLKAGEIERAREWARTLIG
ncbi:flavodoxin domain-containing protein [Devosia sp.]|uniref:flavodoxin family protein n=1 Tax=Devosia sp. TaxID=1871048 RepID=UPI0032632029